jgi:hypothetical protein
LATFSARFSARWVGAGLFVGVVMALLCRYVSDAVYH